MQDGPEGGLFLTNKRGLKEGEACWGVIVSMNDGETLSREQIQAFLDASAEVRFEGQERKEVYEWITRTMRRQEYRKQGKKMRGWLRRYMEKMTGRSRTRITLLVARYMEHSEVKVTTYRRHRFASRFTRADLELLARVDEAHETLSGPATGKILEREFGESTRRPNTSGWRRSRWRIFTICASAGTTANAG
jgi:hypothetical protein